MYGVGMTYSWQEVTYWYESYLNSPDYEPGEYEGDVDFAMQYLDLLFVED